MSKPRICLNMIVKDEAEVIGRSLRQLMPLVDYWVIVDTGSRDDTCAIIESVLSEIPGELHRRPWKNFGHNRSEAINLARDKADYLLFFDADDLLLSSPDFRLPLLTADAYRAAFVGGDLRYERIALVSCRLPWRFEGVLHEYPTPDCDYSVASLPELLIESRRDGGRGKDGQVNKYLRDAEVLAGALQEDPRNARNAFYLATSLRDAGRFDQALEAFERRVEMGGWDQEVWYSKLQIAALQERLNHPVAAVLFAYLSAHELRPTRAESLGLLSRYLRTNGNHWELARLFAAQGIKIPLTDDILFVDRSWYDWRCLDEFAVAAYWAGRHQECLEACERLLASGALPEAHRARVIENLNHARRKLGQEPVNPSLPSPGSHMPESQFRIPYQSCPLCEGSSLAELRLAACDKHALYKRPLPSTLRWMQCEICKHVFTEGYWSNEALDLIFSSAHPGQLPGNNPHASRLIAARMVERVLPHLEPANGVWLDVGFGNGALLGAAEEYGFSVVGLDLRSQAVERMRSDGVNAYCTEFEEYQPEVAPRVISMADVLEHMPFPVTALKQAHRLLAPNGVLFVSMPNSDCYAWRMLNRLNENPYWSELEHYHNFGRDRLYDLLRECGFEPVSYGVSERYYLCMEVVARKQE